ncbi:MAG TPA: arylamine N-acetyltransferase [bacterium]|nr:arylamine N-acetyltransferase [bacterium]HPN43754.1 arylamine N-acetyltransferase [bacterium]
MQNDTRQILAPDTHNGAVQQFLTYFNITSEPPHAEYLVKLLEAFTNLPYENISKIIKLNHDFTAETRVRLPEEVMEDHIRFHLGGTCFSLTWFLQALLLSQGFICYPVIAGMRNRPNCHCALVVLQDGKKYLVDPGYLLTSPMEINKDQPRIYRTSHSGVELVFDKTLEQYFLCTFTRHESKWRYFFQDMPVPPEKFLHYWLDSFYQSTMHGLCLTKIRKDGLVFLHKDFLQISNFEGKEKLKVKQNYHTIVQEIWGIDPELVEHALAAIPENIQQQKELGLFYKNKRSLTIETE